MASAVTRVVHRCDSAKETLFLDLSECQLMQVPDAVYHLMRHTELITCNLSGNVITKIPPKFAVHFAHITELNLSNNQMSRLPDEFADLSDLEKLDISHNSFIDLPQSIYKMPKLSSLNASHNYIVDVDVGRLQSISSIELVDLEENPLTRTIISALEKINGIRIIFTIPELEEWEDLTA